MARISQLKPRVRVQGDRLAVMVPGSWRTSEMTSGQRGYGYAWQQRRVAQLRAHPLCAYCMRQDRVTAASVADHVIPHRGDAALFRGPLQSLCAACHSSTKAKEEGGAG